MLKNLKKLQNKQTNNVLHEILLEEKTVQHIRIDGTEA